MLAAWALISCELAWTLVLERHQLAGIWEIETGILWLSPVAFAIAALFGILGAGLFALLENSRATGSRTALSTAVGLFSAAAAFGVGSGRHLSDPGLRGGFAIAVGVGFAVATFAIAPVIAAWSKRRPRAVSLGFLLAVAILEVVNQRVLVRLYPAFHWALALCALLLAPSVLSAWIRKTERAPVRALALLGLSVVGPALLAIPTLPRLALLDNFRFVVTEQAPILGRVVEIAARLAAPDAQNPTPCAGGSVCNEPKGREASEKTLDLTRRDILLITVDALRADHVGAYGYSSRQTTPNLDQLASQGVVFEQAYTSTPHTSYAVVSLMTGKYMRPLLLQGSGRDSETWPSVLRTYGYKTAAFFPPAVFFIDTRKFETFQKSQLGFEYVKVEFAEGAARIAQVDEYLSRTPRDKPLFVWVHLFGPHEPYESHPAYSFGNRDIDRYDSEVAAADATLGAIVQRFRKLRPSSAVFVTADHGEEFGEHGGRYHGTSVYEEQLRVPLVVSVPNAVAPRRVREVVSTVDLMPTVLSALSIPRPPRLRGRDLGPLITGGRPQGPGMAHGETDEQTLLARGSLRLVCLRRIGACKLYDLSSDPGQTSDVGPARPAELQALRTELRALGASHGIYESQGLRAEGKSWPAPIVRGLSGDGEVASEVAALLDDVDVLVRRKAAEVLVELRRPETAAALRLALGRDEDPTVQRLSALALTRLGEGAPRVLELLNDPDYRRLASLALGESGDPRGLPGLLEWWRDKPSRDFSRSKQILAALAKLQAPEAVHPLLAELGDVRLRPEIARTLSRIGEESSRVALARALREERSATTRGALFKAIVELGGRYELIRPLVRFLGVPDPFPEGLSVALNARILQHIGGPSDKDLDRLRTLSSLGTRVRLSIPKGGNGSGVRAVIRVECPAPMERGEFLLGVAKHAIRYDKEGKALPQRKLPELDSARAVRISVSCTGRAEELFATLPESVAARPATTRDYVAFASRGIQVHALALVPLDDELPPPAPQAWPAENQSPTAE